MEGKSKFVILIILMLIFSGTIVNAIQIISVESPKEENSNFIPSKNTMANWTVMYYMCGDSYMNYYMDFILDNISEIGSDDELNIVGLVDKKKPGNSVLFYISESGEIVELNEVYGWPEEVDMKSLNTLELFCIQMMQNYPAKYYALIICASGESGWQGYVLGDTDNAGFDTITIPKFANSLENIVNEAGHKIDVMVGSCAVSMIENAYQFNPSLNYLVGTQDCFPDWQVVPLFCEAVKQLKNDKSLTAEEFAIQGPLNFDPVSFIYNEGYGKSISLISRIFDKLPFPRLHSVIHHSNLGAINVTQINNLTKSFDDLASYLLLNILDEQVMKGIKKTRKKVTELAKCNSIFYLLTRIYPRYPFEFLAYDCYIDLYDLVQLFEKNIDNDVIKSKCEDVLNKINQTVTYVANNSNSSTRGMNIYFPENNYKYNKNKYKGEIPMPYEGLKFSEDTCWDEFLKFFYAKK